MDKLTIFTPTYNRANLLKRCYESLIAQTSKEFIWLVIDDGSQDNTEILVQEWMQLTKEFDIRYISKENGGLHTAYNTAISNIDTELCMCIDSDDYLPPKSVENIMAFWRKYGSEEVAGIIGLDADLNGKIIGDRLPNQEKINLIDLLVGKYKIKNGDRTNVVRTELYKMFYPMQTFDNEKNFNPHYLHLKMSKKYDFLIINEPLRIVEYQEDGMSASLFNQYLNSPNSFAETRKLYLSFKQAGLLFLIRQSIHLSSSAIIARNPKIAFEKNNHKILTIFSFPLGFLLTEYIKYKVRRAASYL